MSIADILESKIRDRLIREMTIYAGDIAEQARQNASWSTTIPGAIGVGSVQEDGGRAYIDIVVDLKKAPSAAAFEYGSGLHRKENPAEYKISPREDGPGYLAFPISRWPNYQPPPNVTVAMFPGAISGKDYVMHPGVAERPFLAPAIQSKKWSFRGVILRVFKLGYIEATPRVTVIDVKV